MPSGTVLMPVRSQLCDRDGSCAVLVTQDCLGQSALLQHWTCRGVKAFES